MISRNRLRAGILKSKKRVMWHGDKEDRERSARRHRKTTKGCSCQLCGNPRRHRKGVEKLTKQELEFKGRNDSEEAQP